MSVESTEPFSFGTLTLEISWASINSLSLLEGEVSGLLSWTSEWEVSSTCIEGVMSVWHVFSSSITDEGFCDKSSTKSKNSSVFIRESLFSFVDGSTRESSEFSLGKLVSFVWVESMDSSLGTKRLGSSDIWESIKLSVEMTTGGAILPCSTGSTWSTGVTIEFNFESTISCPCSNLDWANGVMSLTLVAWGLPSEICLSTWQISNSGSSSWSESLSESISGTNFMPKGSSKFLWSILSFPSPIGFTLYTGTFLFGCATTTYSSGSHLFWILCLPFQATLFTKTRSSICNWLPLTFLSYDNLYFWACFWEISLALL